MSMFPPSPQSQDNSLVAVCALDGQEGACEMCIACMMCDGRIPHPVFYILYDVLT